MHAPPVLVRVDVAAKVLALGTVLVPVAGAVSRWVFFAASEYVDPAMAWRLPLTDLAAAGFRAVLYPALVLPIYFLLARALAPLLRGLREADAGFGKMGNIDEATRLSEALVARSQERRRRFEAIQARIEHLRVRTAAPSEPDAAAIEEEIAALELELQSIDRERDKDLILADDLRKEIEADSLVLDRMKSDLDAALNQLPRWMNRLFRATPRWVSSFPIWLLWLPMLFACLLLPIPAVPPILVGLVAYWWLVRLARQLGSLSFSDVAIPITLLVLLSAGLDGLYPSTEQARHYTFAEETSATPSGPYVRVGESEGLHYIIHCPSRGSVLGVPTSALTAVELPPASRPGRDFPPSIVSWAIDRAPLHLGFQPSEAC